MADKDQWPSCRTHFTSLNSAADLTFTYLYQDRLLSALELDALLRNGNYFSIPNT